MCQTQFLRDAHEGMIGNCFEEIGTRVNPSVLCVDKHDFFKDKRRTLGENLKVEEVFWICSYEVELARIEGKGKQKALEDVKTKSES